MNIFRLDNNPKLCAEYHCDKHSYAMIKEYVQQMSTAHFILKSSIYDTYIDILPKKTHINHPCNIWIRNNKENYLWLHELTKYLCEEYNKRYNRHHKYEPLLNILKLPDNFINKQLYIPIPQCMPNELRLNEGHEVEAYRNYYIQCKKYFAKWKLGNIPYWWV